jgi:predicted nucleic acid-binding protein
VKALFRRSNLAKIGDSEADMDIILDANAYIQVLYAHGGSFHQTNRFTELLTHLRRTGSRLVIPELTYSEVVARYRDRLTAVAKDARDGWLALKQVAMRNRLDFLEPDIQSELDALSELLLHLAPGVQSLIYTDYSGIDIKEIARRGVERVRPANQNGEELRDVILWLVALRYAKQSKAPVAFISDDKTFRGADDNLHPSLQADVDGAGVEIAFYRFIGDFVKGNALDSEPVAREALAALISTEELRRISTEQLLASSPWEGTITAADLSRCEIAEAKRYRVADDSYYVESKYTGDATIRLTPNASIFVGPPVSAISNAPQWTNAIMPRSFLSGPQPLTANAVAGPQYTNLFVQPYLFDAISNFATIATEKSYECSFELRLSFRIKGGIRQSLEVDEFLLGKLTSIAATTP